MLGSASNAYETHVKPFFGVRSRASSRAQPNGIRYSELRDDDYVGLTSAVPKEPRVGISRIKVLIVFIIAVILIVPGSWLYRDRFEELWDQVEENPTKALVIASYTKQNVSWLDEIPSDWTPYRYFLDDPLPSNGLSVPRNQGREAMAYLTYIIDHYDNLASYIVFTHGHYRSWHQPEPLPAKIRALNLTALQKEHYISLRCGDQMGCERVPYVDTFHVNWDGEVGMREFWNMIVPYEELPQNISYKCCAQHAVTRKAVKRRSKEDWIRVREPLIGELGDLDMIPKTGFTPQWIVGAWYEKIWHVLFGMGGEYCPSIEYCNMVHFSNAIACDQGIDFHMDDGDAWEDTVCVSAFDGLSPDEPANFTKFDIVDIGAKLHRNRRDRLNKIKDDERKEKERVMQEKDAAIKGAEKPAPVSLPPTETEGQSYPTDYETGEDEEEEGAQVQDYNGPFGKSEKQAAAPADQADRRPPKHARDLEGVQQR